MRQMHQPRGILWRWLILNQGGYYRACTIAGAQNKFDTQDCRNFLSRARLEKHCCDVSRYMTRCDGLNVEEKWGVFGPELSWMAE